MLKLQKITACVMHQKVHIWRLPKNSLNTFGSKTLFYVINFVLKFCWFRYWCSAKLCDTHLCFYTHEK